MPPLTADVPVLVVGAGPTGLLLAGELRRRGVDCRIVDAHAGPLHWDRATVVHPRSLELLESIGVLEPFLAAGVKQRAARLHSDGVELGAIDLATCGSRHPFNLGVSEQVTESILADHLARQGGEVVRGARLVALTPGADQVVATVEHDGARTDVRAGWVVGCDGYHSATRELSGIALDGHDIPDPWAVFDVTLAGWPADYEANYVYLDELPVVLTALPRRRWRVYLRPSAPDSDLVADAWGTLRRYHPDIALQDAADPARFQCHTKVAARYREGRVLIAGDAGHVCSPAEGHGMNSGLGDAFNLAWKLALVCRGAASPALLDSYEAERRPVAEAVTRSGDAVEQAQAVAGPAARRERDAALHAAFADPASQHQEAIAEAELDIDYAGSPIVMGDEAGALRPGQRLPDDVPVRLAGGEDRWLHELGYRAGHTAVLVAGPDVDDLAPLEQAVGAAADPSLFDAAVVAWIDAPTARRLRLDGVTLLAVRPDEHLGLVAPDDHARALARYASLVLTAEM